MPNVANARRTRFKDQIAKSRTSQYGPEPVSYLKTIREREGLTLETMAAKCGVSKQALIRLEQGTYERMLPNVVTALISNFGENELVLTDQYEDFQHEMRFRHQHYFGLDLETDPLIDLHPFRQLRGRLDATPTEVAKALCIPQATIVHWEKHIRSQQSIPKCVINVLDEIGYKKEQINSLVESYTTYRTVQSGGNVRVIN